MRIKTKCKGANIMMWKIIQLIFSIGLIIGGLSGNFVLRGTNSSAALVAFGVLWFIFDIIQIITYNKNADNEQLKKRLLKIGRSVLFYILCGIYIITNIVCIYLLIDEMLYTSDGMIMEMLAILGNVTSIVGVVIVMIKKPAGIIIALIGSFITITFTILSGVFIYGYDPYFHVDDFVGFMLMALLPGILLWLQINHTKRKTVSE